MSRPKTMWSIFVFVFLVVWFVGTAYAASNCGSNDPRQVADEMIGSSGITWMPKVNYARLEVRVSRPDGTVFQRTFASGSTPYLDLSSIAGAMSADGQYTYELRVIPVDGTKRVRDLSDMKAMGLEAAGEKVPVQSGSFLVQGGSIVTSGAAEEISRPQDVLHYDDVIITGSLCVGFDCINGESFGYCTIKLKENNLQLCFEDTSTGTFPTNDWKIQINDTTSGGASYFTLWDTDGGRRPFTIEAGAPAHSLYVEDYGRVGLGTSIPYVELHIVDGDTPTVRLDQDGSSGWTAQSWDLAGNETNFFLRDVTNGSKLCFRVQPNTPSNTLCMRSTGNVGIGTWSPTYALEISRTGSAANLICNQTDGASGCIVADSSHVFIGAKTNHDFRLIANDSVKMTILTSGNVGIGTTSPTHLIHLSGGAYSDGSTWQPSSSRIYKENIATLTLKEAVKALEGLKPVKFNYKINKDEDYIGFIAEDVPELVATKERKSINTMDVVAVLTKVVQDQQKTIAELKKKVAELEKKN